MTIFYEIFFKIDSGVTIKIAVKKMNGKTNDTTRFSRWVRKGVRCIKNASTQRLLTVRISMGP